MCFAYLHIIKKDVIFQGKGKSWKAEEVQPAEEKVAQRAHSTFQYLKMPQGGQRGTVYQDLQ